MDAVPYLLLGLPILALIIGGPLLKNRLRRGASEAGDRAGKRFATEQLDAALDELGTTLVIHAAEDRAREVVASAMAKKQREYVIRSDGAYGIRFVEADDTVVHLVSVAEGTRVQIETFREYFGFPQTVPLWTDLRARIASAAGAHGVAVTEGPAVRYIRGERVDDRNVRWVRDA
ncbi:hypothetical protein [Microbacterium sp. NPDC091662]|uniref:hypothetical protein n=1 Tax=Microbacterium sp. NPDC091662 TaxID=3364211 RepID=UPI003800B460